MVVSFSHYELLGLDRNATDEEIRNAYKLMSKSLHPDKNGYGNALMQQINNAKEVLLDRSKRNEYDREIRNHQGGFGKTNSSNNSAKLRKLQQQLDASERKVAALQRSVIYLEEEKEYVFQELSDERQTHRHLQNTFKKMEKQMVTLKATKDHLEKENHDHTRRIDKYEGKMERISRELRDERRKYAKEVAANEEASKTLEKVERSLSLRSVCYRCDGKATTADDCIICQGNGAIQGLWTKCHSCGGMGSFSSIDGEDVSCIICSSTGAREGVHSMTCFSCKGSAIDCNICYKGKIRGFNLQLCPLCNGRDAIRCENCHGKSFVSCQCGLQCRGHGPHQVNKVSSPSSLQRTLALQNGDEIGNSWKAKFFSRNWNTLALQQEEVKGIFI
jgi:DnaJ-class molecular chaperone